MIFFFYSDIAAWPVLVPDDLRVNWIKRRYKPIQVKGEPFYTTVQ